MNPNLSFFFSQSSKFSNQIQLTQEQNAKNYILSISKQNNKTLERCPNALQVSMKTSFFPVRIGIFFPGRVSLLIRIFTVWLPMPELCRFANLQARENLKKVREIWEVPKKVRERVREIWRILPKNVFSLKIFFQIKN